jgi:dephospho-CoA kinase
MTVIAIHAPREVRYSRLAGRKVRPLTKEEAMKRDIEEVEKHNCLGPIARADYTLVNDGTLDDLKKRLENILKAIAS